MRSRVKWMALLNVVLLSATLLAVWAVRGRHAKQQPATAAAVVAAPVAPVSPSTAPIAATAPASRPAGGYAITEETTFGRTDDGPVKYGVIAAGTGVTLLRAGREWSLVRTDAGQVGLVPTARLTPKIVFGDSSIVAMEGRPEPAPNPDTKYQVMAAMLIKFAQHVTWPAAAFDAPDSPICIGVFGKDPFGAALEHLSAGTEIGGRKIALRRSAKLDDLKPCHIVFISKSEAVQINRVLEALNHTSAVTVSEIPVFTRRGGIIGFYLANDKVRFEINNRAAIDRSINISSALLRVARDQGPGADDGKS